VMLVEEADFDFGIVLELHGLVEPPQADVVGREPSSQESVIGRTRG
jgi:hypothetical protein